jgi:hypothetical protein
MSHSICGAPNVVLFSEPQVQKVRTCHDSTDPREIISVECVVRGSEGWIIFEDMKGDFISGHMG